MSLRALTCARPLTSPPPPPPRAIHPPATHRAATAAAPADTIPATKEIFRADYTPYPYELSSILLDFDLREDKGTRVRSTIKLAAKAAAEPLVLDGDAFVTLKGVAIDGAALDESAYELSADGSTLTITSPPSEPFELTVDTAIAPEDNSQLDGLYKSSGNFCTQCEAQGFRRITFFPDRPDVMTTYVTRIEADKAKYPVLLGNGDLMESGDCADAPDRHFAVWNDPWKKPAYLFALVAGDLASIEDSFTTKSGKEVTLRVYTEAHNIHKCDYAMASLKASMKWDEDVYGLEYDLGLFNIVAVDDFNMGAMENKSLNIFNSRLVLATPETATDADYERIEGVVGHEYFHNWSGNRVTLRDWFQLSLKEGLTVFRDQSFTADMNDAAVKRIADVVRLRASQFPEDASPMAHPVRPDSYVKMDNFYTVTVYEKGAEVVRMYHTLLGAEGFRKGTDLYFSRNDGCAVTCDDFRAAMAEATGADLEQFGLWYSQSGTPNVTASGAYDAEARTYTLTLKQSMPATPKQPAESKQPMLMPFKVGLVGRSSKADLPLSAFEGATEGVLRLSEAEQTYVFEDVAEEPVLSLNRGFSAPVNLETGLSDADLLFLAANDSDSFNRWEALQTVGRRVLLGAYERRMADGAAAGAMDALTEAELSALVEAMRAVLADAEGALDDAFAALAVKLPTSQELAQAIECVDPLVLHECRSAAGNFIASQLRSEFEGIVASRAPPAGEAYSPDHASKAKRALRSTAVQYLAKLAEDDASMDALVSGAYDGASNMTEQLSALAAAAAAGTPCSQSLLDKFFAQWKDDKLVMLKWLQLYTGSDAEGNLANVQRLVAEGPVYDINNPNSNYALLGGFASSAVNFHAADGSGYKFHGEMIQRLDGINAQVAARMVGPFIKFRKYDEARQAMMRAQLEMLRDTPGLSANTLELVTKSLDG